MEKVQNVGIKSIHISGCKFSFYFVPKKKKKPTFSILHIQFYKTPTSIYLFFFLQFFIILSLTAPLFHRPNNTNDHSTPSLHHHPPNQHHQGKSTHSIRETNTPKLTPIRNPVHRRSGLIISSIQNQHNRLHHQLYSHHTHRRTPTPLFAISYAAPILEKKKG